MKIGQKKKKQSEDLHCGVYLEWFTFFRWTDQFGSFLNLGNTCSQFMNQLFCFLYGEHD